MSQETVDVARRALDACLATKPEATKRVLQGVVDSLTSHARKIGAALAVGAYLTIEGLARLVS